MPARYAIYFAPATDSVLWKLASEWLGRDAASREKIAQIVPQGVDANRLAKMTSAPRRYGFHATLKAPMRLASSTNETDFLNAAQSFADGKHPVDLGLLAVSDLAGFIALQPVAQNQATTQFAAECVKHFDPFRAPMTAQDREERLGNSLTPRQAELLDQYGYQYVMEEFRFHMTLSECLDEPMHAQCMNAAKEWFSSALDASISLDRITVYKENEPVADHIRLADFPLGGNTQTDT